MSIQLVIPMAGLGTRFSNQGYTVPKPLLPIGKHKMIEIVVDNLSSEKISNVILIANQQVSQEWNLSKIFETRGIPTKIIEIHGTTDGPASTCMLAKDFLKLDSPLVIANSDQFVDSNFSAEYDLWLQSGSDGVIWGMEDSDPKWSYVSLDKDGFARMVKEKVVISNLATCGIYGFSKACYFINAYQSMKLADDRTNGELYVAPTYNYLINDGKKILVRNLGPTNLVMHGLGVPNDYEKFLESELVNRFI